MIITTSNEVVGRRTVRSLGLVRGNTLRARHIGHDIAAVLRSLVGGEITDYTKMLAEAREQALDRLVEEARALGADGVVALRFSTSYIMANVAEILVYGTAVSLEPAPDEAASD